MQRMWTKREYFTHLSVLHQDAAGIVVARDIRLMSRPKMCANMCELSSRIFYLRCHLDSFILLGILLLLKYLYTHKLLLWINWLYLLYWKQQTIYEIYFGSQKCYFETNCLYLWIRWSWLCAKILRKNIF